MNCKQKKIKLLLNNHQDATVVFFFISQPLWNMNAFIEMLNYNVLSLLLFWWSSSNDVYFTWIVVITLFDISSGKILVFLRLYSISLVVVYYYHPKAITYTDQKAKQNKLFLIMITDRANTAVEMRPKPDWRQNK